SQPERSAGPGSIYVKGPGATYGDLTVDNGPSPRATAQATSLPSLGNGTALSGTANATLVTDRASDIPAYFKGHWVEIRNAGGTVKGTWRIGQLSAKTATLLPNAGETISLAAGDKWQGVYLFDKLIVPNTVTILGADPIRIGVNGTVAITGPVAAGANATFNYPINGTNVALGGNITVGAVTAQTLTLNTGVVATNSVTSTSATMKNGAMLQPWPYTTATGPNALKVNVSGTLTIEGGATIDANGLGYAAHTTYPGASLPTQAGAGSHIGYGGRAANLNGVVASTFGSVYFPQEAGGGGEDASNGRPGGGIIQINAGTIVNDGVIRAQGRDDSGGSTRGDGGGSIWITATTIGGNGTVDARGGNAYYTGGGGGAVSVTYAGLVTGTTMPWTLSARGGTDYENGSSPDRSAGAGSIYVKGPGATYGDLTVDNGPSPKATAQATALPSLGAGTVQDGVLYADNFNDLDDAGWTRGDGTWSVTKLGDATVYAQTASPFQGLESIVGSTSWTNYTVEADLYMPSNAKSYSHAGIIFRAQNTANYEVVYFRPHSSGTSQAIQYLPVTNGNLGSGPIATATIPWNSWFHVKVTVNGNQASVYVTDMTTPKLTVTLAGGWSAGAAGLFEHEAPAYFDNFLVTANLGTHGLPANTGATLVAGPAHVQPYFAGHWVDVSTATGTLKGTWRVKSNVGRALTLEPNANETIDVQAGDLWRGVYRFDTLRLRNAKLQSADAIRYATIEKDAGSTFSSNDAAPRFASDKLAQIVVESAPDKDYVSGPIGAVLPDPDTPIVLTAKNVRTAVEYTGNANGDGSFKVQVAGVVGDTFTLKATDSHAQPLSSPVIAVNGQIVERNGIASLAFSSTSVTGGTSVMATVRLAAPARTGGAPIALSSSSPATAAVPSTILIPAGAWYAQFTITTTAPASQVAAVITATSANAVTATLEVLPASAAVVALAFSSAAVEAGTGVDATVTLGAPAPAGGAVVTLLSNSPNVRVPVSVTIPAGSTQATFGVATSPVGTTSIGKITAIYGATKSASLTLSTCSSTAPMALAAKPASTPLIIRWVD
ncbi:MAG TPA: family 16 glycoside hydrolase, partial [Thermoanaerobaculia bacterium]|nr:family 16 glycoside hydrolase [Thermoanaerobaculia bacterium]